MIKSLTKLEFQSTIVAPMKAVMKSSTPVVDIWQYVAELVKSGIVENYTYENNLVESVYRNADNSFDHVLLPSSDENIFIVMVIDIINLKISGYYRLNISEFYATGK